jgi:general secretion pathway protein I
MKYSKQTTYVSGFTLLELLVAMAIFATAGIAIMQATSAHLRSITLLEDMTFASFVANNQMQLTLLDQEWPGKEQQQGEVEQGNRKWLWQLENYKLADAQLRLIKIQVSLADTPEDVLYSLQSYKGKPDG